MKTKEQVAKYASQCHFSDEDWQKVLDYCREKFGGGRVRKSQKPLSESTYQQFLQWINYGFAPGEIVHLGNTTGIVYAYTPDYACLAAYLSYDGDLMGQRLEVLPHKIERASDEEKELMMSKLRAKNLRYSISLGCLAPNYQPADGEFVRVTIGESRTTGIFRMSDGSSFYFYAFVSEGKILKDYIIGMKDAVLSKSTKTDMDRLLMTLSQNKLEWGASHKQLRHIDHERAVRGGRYWYLTERFSVCSDVDMYTKKHDERFKNSNYFCSFSAAMLFSSKVLNIRKEIAGIS